MSEDSSEGMTTYNRVGLFLGPALALGVLFGPTPEGMSPEGQRCAAVAVLMSTWWLTEALPLAATALLPLALFPLLGVIPAKEAAAPYGDPNIFLFAGGFFIAMSIQKWNLHERIALNIIHRMGTKLPRLVLGFMIATAFLSMWISNTATCLMMMPIALAVISQLEERFGRERTAQFTTCVLLGVAYASSIGGVATLIGTPPNIILVSQYKEFFSDAPPIGFLQWMTFGVPFMILFIAIAWFILVKIMFRTADIDDSGVAAEAIQTRLTDLGRMTRGEITVSIVGIATALAWIFRADMDLGGVVIPGWADLFGTPKYIDDSTVAIFFASLLFVIPVDWKKGEFALDWDWAKRIPWGVLILFGGGLSLAKGFDGTGLVQWLGGKLTMLETMPDIAVIFTIAILLTILTEFTSNTAVTAIMLPILAAAAPALGLHPLLLMIPATVAASCGFMMPAGTPPNAIVFSAERLTIPQMAKAGFLLDLIGTLLITALVYFVAMPVFGIEPGVVPDWANSSLR